MDRLARFALAFLLVSALSFTLFGGVPGAFTAGPVGLLVPLGAVALWTMAFRRSSAGFDLGWAGRTSAAIDLSTARGPSADGPPAWMAHPRPPASRRSVSRALGRAERRQWLSSGWFAAGLGFCLLMIVLFGWVFAYDNDGAGHAWRSWFVLYPIMAHPMAGMAVVGAHQAVTRGRRDRTEELFEACPVDEATRTGAHLRCAWVPAAAIAAFIVVMTLVLPLNNDAMYGSIDRRALADVLAAVALGACGAWLGVALGRWAPWRLVPVVFVAALVPVIVELGTLGAPHWSNLRQLSTWPQYPDHDLIFTDPPLWWHLAWLGGLGALMAVVGMAHARRGRRLLAVGLAVAIAAATAGIAQTRPLSEGAATRIASLVAQPELHQTCRAGTRVEVCVYHGYEGFLDVAFGNVAAVAAAAPASTAPVVFRQAFDGDLDALGPEVARALRRLPTPQGGSLLLGYRTNDHTMNGLRLTTALAAVGLPTRAGPGDLPTVIVGQARGVVALWLAARGLDPRAAQELAGDHYNPDDDVPDRTPTALDLGMAWPNPCDAGPAPVAWSAQDLAAARALLALPDDHAHDLLLAGWAQFTDPTTTTVELLAAAGLDQVGPPDHVVAAPFVCTY